jgi:hypothetical protein
VQETSDWRAHDWDVVSEQRKSNGQHPNTYHREREETPGSNECDTSQHPYPNRTLATKAVQFMADPCGDVILEAVHFLVEIGSWRHARLSGVRLIRSYVVTPQTRDATPSYNTFICLLFSFLVVADLWLNYCWPALNGT